MRQRGYGVVNDSCRRWTEYEGLAGRKSIHCETVEMYHKGNVVHEEGQQDEGGSRDGRGLGKETVKCWGDASLGSIQR